MSAPEANGDGGRVVILASHAAEGGTVNYSNALARSLAQAGYAVHRMALYRSPTWDKGGFDEIILPLENPTRLQQLTGTVRLIRRLRALRPDVILGVMPLANVVAGVAGFGTRIKVVATQHSPLHANGKSAQFMDRVAGTLGAYSHIVSVSHAVAQSYDAHPPAYRRRMTVIPNGIPAMPRDGGGATIREKYGIAPGRPFALMAGRLAEQKNVLRAIEAMAKIPEADFLLSGRGALEQDALELIERLGAGDHIRLIGLVDRQDLVNLMYACEAFVQVSLFEGQSVALLEAIHAGAALVVSAIPTQIEVVETPVGLAAATCDPNDPDDIARALRTAMFDPAGRAAILRAGATLQATIRSEAQTHSEYLALLHSVSSAADRYGAIA